MHRKRLLYPSEELFALADVKDLRQLFFVELAKHTYTENYHLISTNTRQACNIGIPFMHKTIGQRSSLYLGPRVFNQLPREVKNAKELRHFRTLCEKYMKQKTREYIHKQIDIKNC